MAVDTSEVQCHAVARSDALDRRAERLDGPHPGPLPHRFDHHVLVDLDRTVGQRASDHRPAATCREDAVDPQAGSPAIRRRRCAAGQPGQLGAQAAEADAARRSDGHDRRTGEERSGDSLGDLEHGQVDEVRIVEDVDLGECDHAVVDADELEDAQVLLALWLPSLGGGHDEEAGVDASDTGQHVAQESHVAGHVDEGDRLGPDVVSDGRVGEPEVDGQAAAVLLLQTVGVGAGERHDERRLAMVDVSRRGNDPHAGSLASSPGGFTG